MFNFSLVLTSTLKLVPKMSLKNGFGIIKNVNNKDIQGVREGTMGNSFNLRVFAEKQ